MAIAEAAKIVFQTALAGTLEFKGFRRVSDTNYVIEGDGVEWRVVFGPEFPDDPGTFREETGIFLPEVDELYQRAFPKDGPVSEPMARTKYRAHYCYNIEVGHNDAQRKAGKRNPDFTNVEPCFRTQEGNQGRREHWTTNGHDLQALGIRIDTYWKEWVWPFLESRMTKKDACRYSDGTLSIHSYQEKFFGPWVCGYKSEVIEELRRRKALAQQSEEDIRKFLITRAKDRYPGIPFRWMLHLPKQEDIDSRAMHLRKEAELADYLASVLGVML